MRAFLTEDGYTFFEQADGTLTDTFNPEHADLTYNSREEIAAVIDVIEITGTSFGADLDAQADVVGGLSSIPCMFCGGRGDRIVIQTTSAGGSTSISTAHKTCFENAQKWNETHKIWKGIERL